MAETRMARQQFVILKHAIDALVGAGTPGLSEADAALCRQFACLLDAERVEARAAQDRTGDRAVEGTLFRVSQDFLFRNDVRMQLYDRRRR